MVPWQAQDNCSISELLRPTSITRQQGHSVGKRRYNIWPCASALIVAGSQRELKLDSIASAPVTAKNIKHNVKAIVSNSKEYQ